VSAAPTAPAGLTPTVVSATQINLAWTAATDNVGVTGYQVERCQGAGCANFAQIATPTATSFSDTGLAAATSYSYRVRATDAAGNLSAYSSVASATTGAAAAAQVYFIHTDHLNTPRVITNQASQVVWRWDHTEPFGANPPNENPSGLGNFTCNLRLPGQYFDRETNTHYNYFRDYDPAIGRYIQSDPIGLEGGINTYAYVRNNPLSFTDPTGEFASLPAWVGTVVLVGTIGYKVYQANKCSRLTAQFYKLWEECEKQCPPPQMGPDPASNLTALYNYTFGTFNMNEPIIRCVNNRNPDLIEDRVKTCGALPIMKPPFPSR
jgi:RHS repeat-associated protein